MTVTKAIALLKHLQTKHGGEVEVFFDCPACNQSFTPGVLCAIAVHFTEKPPKETR